ncbi:MAG: phosphotransferase [Gaiellales bacterium]
MDALAGFLQGDATLAVVLDVLGTVDPDDIVKIARTLEPDAAEIFSFTASVGVVFGIRRGDGSRVALKIFGRGTDVEYLDRVQELQRALRDAGFPAPRPLGRQGTAIREEWVDRGRFVDGHRPEARAAMARELARFHELAARAGVAMDRRPPQPHNVLWPPPHNVLFDFEATAAGAEWIDEIAHAARAVPVCGATVIGHDDWAAKHLRFDDDFRLTALYDWDSIKIELETVLVGHAAGSFTYTEELAEPVELWPSADESLEFIAAYEESEGDLSPRPSVGRRSRRASTFARTPRVASTRTRARSRAQVSQTSPTR